MILVFKELKPGKNEFDFTSEPAELDLPQEDPAFRERVSVNLVAYKQVTLIEIRLIARTRAEMICSRCGETFSKDVEGEATYIIRQGSERLSREKTLSDEDIYTIFTTEGEMDTLPLIREVLLLEVPMRPLCRDDCAGLCPVCGANWNVETCPHRETEEEDAPQEPVRKGLAALQDLWKAAQNQHREE